MTDDVSYVTVTRVIDGDTFEFLYDSTTFQVRVLELDTYESTNNSRAKKQSKELGLSEEEIVLRGKKAKEFSKNLLTNKVVQIQRTSKNADGFGRLLRKVNIDGISYDSLMIANKLGIKFK